MALMLALQSPELEILGITTVAGNDSLNRATSDALRMLEIGRQPDIPVYRGANRPLQHVKSEYAENMHGNWYSDESPPMPPGGYPLIKARSESALSFILQTVLDQPGEVTIVAIGPLTNIALAIQADAKFAESVKKLVIMGGAVPILPDGAGNMTPSAEFNFWVDPEAAYVTLRSGIPIELSPLNVSRKSYLTKDWYEKLTAVDNPFTRLLRDTVGERFVDTPNSSWHMHDQIAVASLIDPSLVKTESLIVDVDTNKGINYGASVAGRQAWPGAEGASLISVQYDLDWPRFIELFIERVQSLPANENGD